jgi:hypothetical protein
MLSKFSQTIFQQKAINWSCQEVVGILIKSGCDPNEKGQNGITPLMKGYYQYLSV